MKALYDCRLEDIGRYDRVKVECGCGRVALLGQDAFTGQPSYRRVKGLRRLLRCDNCGKRGGVDVSVVWGEYKARRF
jgi:hypothetical protein